MQNETPCDFLGAERQAMSQERHDDAAREHADRVYLSERRAFLAAVSECSLKLPRSGMSLWDRVVMDMLYLDKRAGNWEARRAMFEALNSCPLGVAWLAEMAERHAKEEADNADTEYEE